MLEGAGWRAAPDHGLRVRLRSRGDGQGSLHGTLYASSIREPLLAFPLLVSLLFYLRGLYRTRLRALVLDGVVPVISAVSSVRCRRPCSGCSSTGKRRQVGRGARMAVRAARRSGVGAHRAVLRQRWARAHRLVGKPVLIMGAGVVGAQVARRLESHPEYGLADRLPRRGPPLDRRGGRSRPAVLAPSRTSTRPSCAPVYAT